MANYVNNLGQTRLGWRVPTQAQLQTATYLLDSYSGAAAAYSLRKLKSSYTGSAIRVRRSSDNTEQNIGFNADGTLNTLSLLAFVGSGTGFVTTWYDQSGNNRNATQVSASNQPLIVDGGVLYTLNGKAIIRNPNANVIRCLITPISSAQTRPISIIASGKIYSLPLNGYGNVGFYLGGTVNAGAGSTYAFSVTPSSFGTQIRYGSTTVNTINTYNTYSSFIHQGHFASSVLTSRINGIDATTTITDSAPFAVNSNFTLIGANAVTTDFIPNIGMYEYIFYFSDRTSDRVGIESNINTHYSIYATDTDAQAFINAASITDGTQISAIDTLVTSLKSAGIWTKMKAIYPFVGGSAAQHRFNLKDPRSVDAAFYLTFYGGISHSNLGVTFNGTTGYADMKLTRSQVFTNIDGIIGMYTPTTSLAVPGVMFGVTNQVNADFAGLYDGTSLKNLMYPTTSLTYTTSLQGFNWFGVDINTTTHRSIFKNGVRVAFTDGYSAISPDYKVYMAAVNRAGTSYGDNFAGIYSFAFASNTLNSTEALAFYNAVQTYQTTLGRQV